MHIYHINTGEEKTFLWQKVAGICSYKFRIYGCSLHRIDQNVYLAHLSVTLLQHGIGKVNRLEVRQGFSNSIFCELQEASREIHL